MPRAELYAIVKVVQCVSHGWVIIVSDSLINIDLWRAGSSKSLRSSNADLWRLFYDYVSTKGLHVKLVWVPGHLDTKKAKHNVPDFFFQLNHAADHYAAIAAHKACLPMHIVSGVLWLGKLVLNFQV